MTTCVLVHGAWHSGDLLEGVAQYIRAAGHIVHAPTLAYVPNDGESLEDITPSSFGEVWRQIREQYGGIPMLYPVFREAPINDGDEETARYLPGAPEYPAVQNDD